MPVSLPENGQPRVNAMRYLALTLLACTGLVAADGRWSTAAPIPEPIQEMHAAVLHGKIYIAGLAQTDVVETFTP